MSSTAIQAVPLPRAEPRFGPTPGSERIASIDFIRGVALLGILLVNVTFLFGPVGLAFDPGLISQTPRSDQIAYLTTVSVCQGKFISIFSMLFGYGLLGQIEKVAAAGRSPAWFVCRRLGALACFGFLHAVAVWYGDVLFIYAAIGGWLLLARGVSARYLLIFAAIFLFVGVGLRACLEMLGTMFAPASVQDGSRGLEAMLHAQFDPGARIWVEAEIAAYRDGPWRHAQAFRLAEWLINLTSTVLSSGWQVLGMFFVGAAMWRVRFFAPEQRALRRRVLLTCLPLGIVLEATAGWFFWTGLRDRSLWAVGGTIQGLSTSLLPIGYLAGLALLADRLPNGVRAPIVSAGRMALTVYLLESVISTALSYHWGLQWFGRIGALRQVPLAAAVWAGLVLFAWAYLRRFRQGPMEAVWRLLEYGGARHKPEAPDTTLNVKGAGVRTPL